MESIGGLLMSPATDAPIGLHVVLGLPPATDLLTHHDLDNFLEPLATHIGPMRIARASATKAIGSRSMLTLGPVEQAPPQPEGKWFSATVESDGLSNPARRRFGRALAQKADPLPWGPVELEVSVRLGARRNIVSAWKALIDSVVVILGRVPGKSGLLAGWW